MSASQKHIIWLQSKIKLLKGIGGAVIKNLPVNKNRVPIWELKFAKKESLKLIDWIYHQSDVPCLERKRAITQSAVEIIKNQKRREYARI